MTTGGQPGHGWTVVLRRQPARIVDGRPQGGYTDALSSSAANAVTIPTWITGRSQPGFGRSAGRTRSRQASPHMGNTSCGTGAGGRPTGAGLAWTPARKLAGTR
jgi:hypothetical protein